MSPPSPPPTPHSTLAFDPTSHFERAAATYEDTSPVMKQVASHLLTLSPPLTSTSIIHDNACGPGIVTGEILSLPQFTPPNPPPTIHATDNSPAMIRALTTRSARSHWPPSTPHARVLDSMDLSPFPANTFTHTYMASAIFLIPDPVRATREIHRTLQPSGGVALITSFEKQEFISIFQAVAAEIRPDLPPWHGPLPREWLTEAKLRDVVEAGGFERAKVDITRYSAWVSGESWSKPGLELLREGFLKGITKGWSEVDRERFVERLAVEMESERVKAAEYEMGFLVAVARK